MIQMNQNCHVNKRETYFFSYSSKINFFSANLHHQNELNEPITRMTITRLEEQIQILKVKVETIGERLNNITSILQETHLGNV
jgi:hypothetical protein